MLYRIITRPNPVTSGRQTWSAETEAGEALCAKTRHPLYDGARVLIERGGDPEALVTLRHTGADHDSFRPMRLRSAARLTTEEGEAGPIRVRAWLPHGAGEYCARPATPASGVPAPTQGQDGRQSAGAPTP